MATQIWYGEIAMMGEQSGLKQKIFYPHINLEQRVPQTHLLRRIKEQIDFNFIYTEVRDAHGSNGNESGNCNIGLFGCRHAHGEDYGG